MGLIHPYLLIIHKKDDFKRLAEIKTAIDKGDTHVLIELIFLPLYVRVNELELCKAKKMLELLLAATLIMSNKILDDDALG